MNIQWHSKHPMVSVLADKILLIKTKGRYLILYFSLQNEYTKDGN